LYHTDKLKSIISNGARTSGGDSKLNRLVIFPQMIRCVNAELAAIGKVLGQFSSVYARYVDKKGSPRGLPCGELV